ncbi:AMP-binding protein [Nocardia jejuensis]|uniref:AMP-binding protein n=1 Tax=Nocardia jejuensis TaxID=328049 RepID=UPI0008340AF5|nr:AMP-binding protein [Nocardia jejuensis]
MCKPVETPVATLVQFRASSLSAASRTTQPVAAAPVRTPAATSADCELTHEELERWSNRMARMLLRLGARPGVRIAIEATPQLETVVARLAISKTGATLVPFTTESSAARVDFGITTKEGRDRFSDRGHWLVLDDRSTLVQYLTGSDAPLTEAELHTTRKAS